MYLRLIVLGALLLPGGLSALSVTPARLAHMPENTKELKGCRSFGDEEIAVLKRFPKLEVLDCWYLNLTEKGWQDLSALKSLKEFTVGGGGVSGEHLASIAQLSRLEVLEIDCNTQCDDVEIQSLLQLKLLRKLRICGFWGTAAGLTSLADLPLLSSLSLVYATELADADLAVLDRLPALKELALIRCELLTDAGLTHLGKLAKLESIDLDAWDSRPTGWTAYRTNEWTGKGLRELAKLKHLRRLNLRGSGNLTDDDMAVLAKIETLEYLNVADCERVTDAGIQHLAKLPRLQHLVAFGLRDEPRGDGFKDFGAESVLSILEVPNTYRLPAGFFSAVASLPHLRVLNMEQCSLHEAGSMVHLAGAAGLTELFAHNLEPSPKEFAAICTLKSLRVLSFGAENLGDKDVEPLADLQELQTLKIVGMKRLGDPAISTIGKLVSLQELELVGPDTRLCTITDKALEHLKNLTKLRSVYFLWIRTLGETFSGLEELKSIESIRIDRCGKIGPSGMRRVLSLPMLREAWLHSVDAFPTDADLKPSESLESLRFEYASKGIIDAAEAWAKNFPLLDFSGS